MTKDEALDKALEALGMYQAAGFGNSTDFNKQHEAFYKAQTAIIAIKQARALDKMAENARALGLDYEPHKGLSEHLAQVTNGRVRIDPVTGDVGIGTPEAQPAPVQEPVFCEYCGGNDDADFGLPTDHCTDCARPQAAQPAPVQETKKSIVEALEAVAAYFYDGPVRNTSVVAACEKALNDIAGKEIYESWTPKDQAKLEDIEQYRMQMAGISTAAIGYWKEGDSIHPDYDTTALRDVAKLYARYAALYTTQPAAQRQRVVFPTMLRKMWSGGEVQAWLDENVNKEKNT
jgi:hypothetical protein